MNKFVSYRLLLTALCVSALTAIAPRHPILRTGTFKLDLPRGPYISQSRVPTSAGGITGAYSLSVIGPGKVSGSTYVAPAVNKPQTVILVAAAQGGFANAQIKIVPPPAKTAPLLAVASYYDGIVLHDPKTFAIAGFIPIGGAPGDVTFLPDGSIAAPDTDGENLAFISRAPWNFQTVGGVLEGNEIVADGQGNMYVSDRDVGPNGALTKISATRSVSRVITGVTAEGLALDAKSSSIYVGNVNDASIAQIDTNSLKVIRKFRSVERTMGIALDSARERLFVVSNQSRTVHGKGGFVAALDLRRADAPAVARSSPLVFPLGVTLDSKRNRLFVTDEGANVVYVFDPRTLRQVRAPLLTCLTPWRPRIAAGRLYVPCSRANRIDVFDLATLRRVRGAPFETGRFPISIAQWP